MTLWNGLCRRLGAHLAHRLERDATDAHADWIRAMLVEGEACADGVDRFRWLCGCWRASLGLPGALDGPAYVAALTLGVLLMIAHQWVADEGLGTLACLGAVSLTLGLIRPRRSWTSGGVIGLIVAAVLAFELVSGVRPPYEHDGQTLGECLHWSVLAIPALLAAGIGAWLRRRFDAAAFHA